MSSESRKRRDDALGAAPRAFLTLSGGDAAFEAEETSRARKLAALILATLMLAAVPILWAAGPGADQALPASAGKSASGPGHGGDDDDDNSGPGTNAGPGGDSDNTSRRGTTRGTTTGTGRGDTRNSTRGGTTRTNTGTTASGVSGTQTRTGRG